MSEDKKEQFKQVGIVTMRYRETDEMFSPEPIYIKIHQLEISKKTKLSVGEEIAIDNISKILADKYSSYIKGLKKPGIDART